MQRHNMYQAQLLDRYLQGMATPEEAEELFAWLRKNSPGSISRLEEIIKKNYTQAFSQASGLSDADSEQMLINILDRVNKKTDIRPKVRTMWYRIAAAVVILVVAGVALYFLFPGKSRQPINVVKASVDVQAPQSSHAVIILANGNKVLLDSAANGQLALQGKVRLVKLATGHFAYESSNLPAGKAGTNAESGKLTYNTLTNPRGSQVIDMTLSDGSRVWLNAGSSVMYPVAFATHERRVSITGEAYFEVAHNANKPFYVTKGDMEVKVLGTRFNVNAYHDEKDMKVTLLEGRVAVTLQQAEGEKELIIKPGEQAVAMDNGQLTISRNVDVQQVMAWKNGLFNFDGMGLKEAVPQLERWYDISAAYEAGMPDVPLFGKIDRNLSLSDLLGILRGAGFRFRLEEGRKLVLMK